MQAKLGHDALDAAGADGMAALSQLLRNDRRRGIRVEETVADHLLNDLIGAPIMSFGTALVVLQRKGAAFGEGRTQLEIALFGIAKLARRRQRTQAFALAFIEHGEFGQDRIVPRPGQLASRTGEKQ